MSTPPEAPVPDFVADLPKTELLRLIAPGTPVSTSSERFPAAAEPDPSAMGTP